MHSYSFKEESGSGLYYDTLPTGNQYRHLRNYIDDHKYKVVSMLGRRKARHIVHGDGFPRPVRSRQRSTQALLLNS